MLKVNALELRQSLSKIVRKLQRSGEPILLERGRKPAAVLISLEDYQERFAEKVADEKRRDPGSRIRKLARKSSSRESAEELVRELRSGSDLF